MAYTINYDELISTISLDKPLDETFESHYDVAVFNHLLNLSKYDSMVIWKKRSPKGCEYNCSFSNSQTGVCLNNVTFNKDVVKSFDDIIGDDWCDYVTNFNEDGEYESPAMAQELYSKFAAKIKVAASDADSKDKGRFTRRDLDKVKKGENPYVVLNYTMFLIGRSINIDPTRDKALNERFINFLKAQKAGADTATTTSQEE